MLQTLKLLLLERVWLLSGGQMHRWGVKAVPTPGRHPDRAAPWTEPCYATLSGHQGGTGSSFVTLNVLCGYNRDKFDAAHQVSPSEHDLALLVSTSRFQRLAAADGLRRTVSPGLRLLPRSRACGLCCPYGVNSSNRRSRAHALRCTTEVSCNL